MAYGRRANLPNIFNQEEDTKYRPRHTNWSGFWMRRTGAPYWSGFRERRIRSKMRTTLMRKVPWAVFSGERLARALKWD